MNILKALKCFILISFCCLLSHCKNESSGASGEVSASSVYFGKCDHRNNMNPDYRQCREWTGPGYETYDVQADCDAIDDGQYAMGTCPNGNLVGTCTINWGQLFEMRFFYYSDNWDETAAADSCENKELEFIVSDAPSRWQSASP